MEENIEEDKLKQEIIRAYQGLNKNVLEYRKEVMNRLSEYFPSDKMKYVYSIITAFENKK